MQDLMLSLLMLVAIALIVGAIVQWRRQGPSHNMWLILVLAAIMLANVAIWVIPDSNGAAPMNRAAGPQ